MFRKHEQTVICNASRKNPVTYPQVFWLFTGGSLLGVLIEGLFSIYKRGRWETHVVSIWGPFCILYGIGAVLAYVGNYYLQDKSRRVQFFSYCAVGFSLELLCGMFLEHFLSMRAWNYSRHFMNIRGHVSLSMTVAWGIAGIAFSYLIPVLDRFFTKLNIGKHRIPYIFLTVFMITDLVVTSFAIVRWKDRHFDIPASNVIQQQIDMRYDDDFMKTRFMEWRFID